MSTASMPLCALVWALRLHMWSKSGAVASVPDFQTIEYDVAIVGSGMAGITAAASLAKGGLRVVVLEAAARVGGRTYTGTPFGFPVDLGGAWIHFGKTNPTYKLATSRGIGTAYTDYDNFLFYKDGIKQTDAYPHWDTYEELHQKLLADASNSGFDVDLESAFQNRLSEYSDPEVKQWLQYYLTNNVAASNAEDPQRLSLKGALGQTGHTCDESWHGAEGDYLLPGGYVQIWEAIKAGATIPLEGDVPERRLNAKQVIQVPSEGRTWEIWTNSKVTAIKLGSDREDSNNAVVYLDGQTMNVEARAVIVTVSMGVLKSGLIQFDPPLSASKQTAIDHSAMGSYEKVLLKFPTIPAPLKDAPGLFDVSSVLSHSIGEFQNLQSYPDIAQPVIVGTVHGDAARRMQRLSTDAAAGETMSILKNSVPTLAEPVASFRTNWTSNPFTLGSYSDWPPQLTLSDKYALQEPEGTLGNLIFAGEGTQICDYGTVNGAAFSGLRAAHLASKIMIRSSLDMRLLAIIGGVVALCCCIAMLGICFVCSKGSGGGGDSEESGLLSDEETS